MITFGPTKKLTVDDRDSVSVTTHHTQQMTESTAPAWTSYASNKCPKNVPHWRIKIREADEEHDGYCSGASSNLEIRKWNKPRMLFLPIHDTSGEITWKGKDLVKLMKWDEGEGSGTSSCGSGSGYCGARRRVEILAIQRIS